MRGHPTLTLVTPENRIYAKKIQKPRALFSFRRMETFSTQKGELEKKVCLKEHCQLFVVLFEMLFECRLRLINDLKFTKVFILLVGNVFKSLISN